MNLSDFFAALRQELGDALFEMVGERAFERWINAGQTRLGFYLKRTQTLSWSAGDTFVALPGDYHHAEEFVPNVGSCGLPAGRYWGGEYVFNTPSSSAGGGKLRYHAIRPRITDDTASTLGDGGNESLVSFALYRFFKRLASSRSDYRMYATITQANGVDIAELEGVSERHLQDFKETLETLEVLQATLYYDD